MMKVEFKDFYGQHIDINDETASGNIRIRVRTSENMSDVRMKKPETCTVETDISLDTKKLRFLIETLTLMLGDAE